MERPIAMLLILILFTHCSIDRTISPLNKQEIKALERFQSFEPEHSIQIGDVDEPGQKLWLCLTFISKENKAPLVNQRVHLYHTSSTGDYEPSDPTDESTARLNGSGATNAAGQLFVQTILPGDYGSSTDNRHIHTSVKDAKPEAYDIHFRQYTGPMGSNFISGSDQHFLAELKLSADSTLVTFLTIEVKHPIIPIIHDAKWFGKIPNHFSQYMPYSKSFSFAVLRAGEPKALRRRYSNEEIKKLLTD